MSRYRSIGAEEAQHSVAQLCRVLQVAPSGYYAWGTVGHSSRAGQPDVAGADSRHTRQEPLHIRRAAHPCELQTGKQRISRDSRGRHWSTTFEATTTTLAAIVSTR